MRTKHWTRLVLCASAMALCLGGCRNTPAQQTDDTLTADTQSQTDPDTQAQPVTEEESTAMETAAETVYIEDTRLAFDPMDEVVYPYLDVVRAYLEAGAAADINDYEFHVAVQAKPVTVSWHLDDATADSYKLEIATKSDFSDAVTETVAGGKTSYDLKYLLRDTAYYLRLTVPGQDTLCAVTSFKTPYLGPRFLDVGGLYQNCRDLGGYRVGEKTVLYNMVIRGSSPDDCQSARTKKLTREGLEFLQSDVGIRTQLDLRGSGENCGRTNSSFASANYVHVPLTAYAECFSASQADLYRDAFRLFADPANYPIYIHCAGGADRTGTVAALLLAYLGVSEDEIVQDYVVTSFSPVCYQQNARSRDNIMNVLNGLQSYSGDTLSEKCKSYLISIGMTQQELYNIRAIMFGESLDDYVPVADHGIASLSHFYSTASGEDFSFKLNDTLTVKEIAVDSTPVAFTQQGIAVSVAAAGLAALEDGVHTVTVTFEDGVSTSVSVSVNFTDLTGDLQVTDIQVKGEQTYVYITASSTVFNGVAWHFHTRRTTLFPDIEPNIRINGQTVADINDNTDMSGYTWEMEPAASDTRHRVPVNISSNGNTMKLVIRTEWLESFLNGEEMTVTLCNGFTYTIEGQTYKVLSDVTYRYTGGVWIKVV